MIPWTFQKGFTLTLQETRNIHDSMNIPKIELTSEIYSEKSYPSAHSKIELPYNNGESRGNPTSGSNYFSRHFILTDTTDCVLYIFW